MRTETMETCPKDCGHKLLVFQVLHFFPLGFVLADFLTLCLSLLFCLVPALCTCSLTLIFLTCPSTLSDDLDSYFWFSPFLANSGSIFSSSLFPDPGPHMLEWMHLDWCPTLANFSWSGYQQELKIPVNTWNTLKKNKYCPCP